MSLKKRSRLVSLPMLLIPLAVLGSAHDSQSASRAPAPAATLLATRAQPWVTLDQIEFDADAERVADLASSLIDLSSPGDKCFERMLDDMKPNVFRVGPTTSSVEYSFEFDPKTGRWNIVCHELLSATIVEREGVDPVILRLRLEMRFD